jgi:hypothetical protein
MSTEDAGWKRKSSKQGRRAQLAFRDRGQGPVLTVLAGDNILSDDVPHSPPEPPRTRLDVQTGCTDLQIRISQRLDHRLL